MSGAIRRLDRARPRAAAAPPLVLLALAWSASGCGHAPPPTVSPVVAVDSDEARKARAEDQAHRDALKRKEAQAARKRRLVIPAEPE